MYLLKDVMSYSVLVFFLVFSISPVIVSLKMELIQVQMYKLTCTCTYADDGDIVIRGVP